MNEREALLFLNLLSIGYRAMCALKDRFGSLSEAMQAPDKDVLAVPKVRQATLQAICDKRKDSILHHELDLIERSSCEVITIADEKYPVSLKQISLPPLVLYVMGSIEAQDMNSIAIVGTRRPTSYGKQAAQDIASALAGQGVTVVSGLARGLDSIAHRAALDVGGRTLAVLGSGLLRLYPHENRALADAVAQNGAVISEFPLETKPFRSNFPIRNRVISGLTMGTVVVEAAAKSGTLITAGFALEQGRAVFSVPGSIYNATSEGANNLIKQGACLYQSVDDIFRELPALHRNGDVLELPLEMPAPVDISSDEKKVLNLIGTDPVYIDDIIEKTEFSAPEIAVLLLTLEIKSIIKQLPGNYYLSN
ncbi:MAG: DNA-protecting protein DprA [Candidatus Auribacter fodinae]|jgi:DNA processing protein|uniref:DNA-protecting protein DprA n=1 Tax=Candidatus Auribacter fodinae TaxID=2093366 RepID=A0A3A4RED2_9BACT|nr:MAG: DNA-protecting protein DprA [Candidatus Auribacter fodinae]